MREMIKYVRQDIAMGLDFRKVQAFGAPKVPQHFASQTRGRF